MTKIEEYSKEIPEEIRRAIRGLDSDYRAAIFVALYKRGELSFSELQKALEIKKAKLNYHLGKLTESALVHHYYKHELGTERYSFYNVTPFGQDFVEILSQFLRPQPCPISLQESPVTSEGFITMGNILTQQMIVLTPEDLKEIIDRALGFRTRTGELAGVCLITNDASIGSPFSRIPLLAKEKNIMKNWVTPPSTI